MTKFEAAINAFTGLRLQTKLFLGAIGLIALFAFLHESSDGNLTKDKAARLIQQDGKPCVAATKIYVFSDIPGVKKWGVECQNTTKRSKTKYAIGWSKSDKKWMVWGPATINPPSWEKYK